MAFWQDILTFSSKKWRPFHCNGWISVFPYFQSKNVHKSSDCFREAAHGGIHQEPVAAPLTKRQLSVARTIDYLFRSMHLLLYILKNRLNKVKIKDMKTWFSGSRTALDFTACILFSCFLAVGLRLIVTPAPCKDFGGCRLVQVESFRIQSLLRTLIFDITCTYFV